MECIKIYMIDNCYSKYNNQQIPKHHKNKINSSKEAMSNLYW